LSRQILRPDSTHIMFKNGPARHTLQHSFVKCTIREIKTTYVNVVDD
jgi:hypothetical protein